MSGNSLINNWVAMARAGLISFPEPTDELPPISQDTDPGKKPFLEIVEDEETGELLVKRNLPEKK